MWTTLVGNTIGKGQYVPFSFADRSDLWAASSAGAAAPDAMMPDRITIAQGLIAGTLVATELGWQPVEDLQAGDRVVTFDSGMRPVKAVKVSTLYTAAEAAPPQVWPVQVPAGALGNRTAMQVLPGQPLLIESDVAEDLFGDAFLMLRAGVLDGYKGITRHAPAPEVTVVTLEFDRDEVVYANGTLLVQCPALGQGSTDAEMRIAARPAPYQCLTEQQGRRLVAAMHVNG